MLEKQVGLTKTVYTRLSHELETGNEPEGTKEYFIIPKGFYLY